MTESAVFNVPRGTAYITYQQLLTYLASFVYYVLLIHVLNLSQIGEISILAGISSVFTTLTQISLPAAATRFMSGTIGSQDPSSASGIARKSLFLMFAFAGPGLLLAIGLSPLVGAAVFGTSDSALLLTVTFVASFLLDLVTLYGAFFLGIGHYAEMVYQNILYVPLSRGLGLVLAYKGFGPLGIPLGWIIGASTTLVLSLYLWRDRLPRPTGYPARPLLIFSLPLLVSALVTLLQGWGDIALLQTILGQLATTGAYYLVISSIGFLSILWVPVAGALYPALSNSYHSNGPTAVSTKLGVATRIVNLTALPTGVTLAAVARTALQAIYGGALENQAIPFAIMAATIVFAAHRFVLVTALQAIGKTGHVLGISITATIVDLATIAVLGTLLGTTAGAIGRALLAISTTLLAWLSLRKVLGAAVEQDLSKSLVLTLGTAAPLLVLDKILTFNIHLTPQFRAPLLLGMFVICFLAMSRAFSVFSRADLDLLNSALPRFLSFGLKTLERVLINPKGRMIDNSR